MWIYNVSKKEISKTLFKSVHKDILLSAYRSCDLGGRRRATDPGWRRSRPEVWDRCQRSSKYRLRWEVGRVGGGERVEERDLTDPGLGTHPRDFAPLGIGEKTGRRWRAWRSKRRQNSDQNMRHMYYFSSIIATISKVPFNTLWKCPNHINHVVNLKCHKRYWK